MVLVLLHFNSIKVQLEHGTIRSWAREHDHFNSIKVQLERPFQYIAQDSDPHFNSIKVQLERIKAKLIARLIQISIP